MIFRGTATALITPFTEDDKVDVQAIRNIVDMQIANGINALVALGTTGEPATLSEEEKEQIVRVCVEQTSGKIPLIVGAGSNSTRQAVETMMASSASLPHVKGPWFFTSTPGV